METEDNSTNYIVEDVEEDSSTTDGDMFDIVKRAEAREDQRHFPMKKVEVRVEKQRVQGVWNQENQEKQEKQRVWKQTKLKLRHEDDCATVTLLLLLKHPSIF